MVIYYVSCIICGNKEEIVNEASPTQVFNKSLRWIVSDFDAYGRNDQQFVYSDASVVSYGNIKGTCLAGDAWNVEEPAINHHIDLHSAL